MPEGELAAWVEASCAAQGVPARVTDVHVVREVAVLLGGPVRAGSGSAGATVDRTSPGSAA
ncbi:MAG: hypothetical protein ACYC90_14130 [Candidatus Nanopelagicales bacterium]